MKRSKIILAVSAAIVGLVNTLAFTNHNNKKFGTGTLYTMSISNHCTRAPCIRNGGPTTCETATYYTFSNNGCHSIGKITPSLQNG